MIIRLRKRDMTKKYQAVLIVMTIFVLGAHSLPIIPQDSPNPESEVWNRVSGILGRFLIDPMANFHLLRDIDQLSYWTMIYDEIKGTRYLADLFSKHFTAAGIDEGRLDMIFFMLKAYTSPTSYGAPKPVISKIVEIASSRPEWFARNLLLRQDWRDITRLMLEADISVISGERTGLREILTGLKDQDTQSQFLGFFHDLDSEKQNELARFGEFLKDPARKLDDLRTIYDLGLAIGKYDGLHIDETGTLQTKDNSILILEKWIENDADTRKVRVLYYMMTHCDDGYPSLLMEEVAQDVFLEHYPLFIAALENEPNWRSVVFSLSYGLLQSERYTHMTAYIPGHSGIEMRIRAQLGFLKRNVYYSK
jgi:hypothetical protein